MRVVAARRSRFCNVCYASSPAIPLVMPWQQYWNTGRGIVPAQSVILKRPGALLDSQLEALHAYATCLVRLKQPDKAAKRVRACAGA